MKNNIVLALLVVAATGCASPATKEGMLISPTVTQYTNPAQKGKFTVASVTGGKATNPMWTSQVSQENFESALKESLAIAGLTAVDTQTGQYKIDANLVSLDQPLVGLTFDVVSNVNYRVYKDGFEKILPIKATGTATFSDAAVAIARLRIANEKSIQNNITEFIKELGKLNELQ